MMRLYIEQKEDIRLRMAELEKKLAESEEERRKLEKTCNILMKAFREEEKMRYKTLNKKYEKFLEDCSFRQRRNDIILRSLCRIEDRSRALFAKTERLKLLKDRYISYLKISEIKENEVSHLWKNFSSCDDVTAKSVRWKTPFGLSFKSKEESIRPERDLFLRKEYRSTFFNELKSRLFDTEYHDQGKLEAFQDSETQKKSDPEKGIRSSDSETGSILKYPIAVEVKSEELASNMSGKILEMPIAENKEIEIDLITKTNATRTQVIGDEESIEKLKLAMVHLDSEQCEPKTRTFPENPNYGSEDIELITEQRESVNRDHRSDHYAVTSIPKARDEDYEDPFESVTLEKDRPKPTEKTLPQGLDGVDYQNETYPESYYEQPVHSHGHTNIAVDVILEEDETEPDGNEEMTDGQGATTWQQSDVAEPRSNSESYREYPNGNIEVTNLVKSQESDSEKSSKRCGGVRNSTSDGAAFETNENRSAGKSNLLRMLESDSESFQIEHGNEDSEHEDSDFDFSFGRN